MALVLLAMGAEEAGPYLAPVRKLSLQRSLRAVEASCRFVERHSHGVRPVHRVHKNSPLFPRTPLLAGALEKFRPGKRSARSGNYLGEGLGPETGKTVKNICKAEGK